MILCAWVACRLNLSGLVSILP